MNREVNIQWQDRDSETVIKKHLRRSPPPFIADANLIRDTETLPK